MPDATRWLLDHEGILHDTGAVTSKRFVINDDPDLADALRIAGLPISFADGVDPDLRLFWSEVLGVSFLSGLKKAHGANVGAPRDPARGVSPEAIAEWLRSKEVGYSLEKIVTHEFRGHSRVRQRVANAKKTLAGFVEICFAPIFAPAVP
jgi:hypothetical protein